MALRPPSSCISCLRLWLLPSSATCSCHVFCFPGYRCRPLQGSFSLPRPFLPQMSASCICHLLGLCPKGTFSIGSNPPSCFKMITCTPFPPSCHYRLWFSSHSLASASSYRLCNLQCFLLPSRPQNVSSMKIETAVLSSVISLKDSSRGPVVKGTEAKAE